MDTNRHEFLGGLIVNVGGFEIFGVFSDRTDFFAVRFYQPEPIVTSATNKIAMLLDQQVVAILAGTNDFEFLSRTKEMFFAVGGIDHMERARSCPGLTQKINKFSVGGKLGIRESGENRFHLITGFGSD